jgi:hypothetical protein
MQRATFMALDPKAAGDLIWTNMLASRDDRWLVIDALRHATPSIPNALSEIGEKRGGMLQRLQLVSPKAAGTIIAEMAGLHPQQENVLGQIELRHGEEVGRVVDAIMADLERIDMRGAAEKQSCSQGAPVNRSSEPAPSRGWRRRVFH